MPEVEVIKEAQFIRSHDLYHFKKLDFSLWNFHHTTFTFECSYDRWKYPGRKIGVRRFELVSHYNVEIGSVISNAA